MTFSPIPASSIAANMPWNPDLLIKAWRFAATAHPEQMNDSLTRIKQQPQEI